MDGIKQENYALLHDDSDIEEFDKSKVEHIKNQQGKLYLRRSHTLFSWTQPQWLCHTVFIVFLISSQAALCILVLTIYADLESIKLGQSPLQKGLYNHPNNLNGSRFENATHEIGGLKNAEMHPDSMDMSNILKKIHTLEMNFKSIKKVVSSHEEDLKVLQEQQQSEQKKYENALERQFNNITRALNRLQNRLEENLDGANSQISQLREDVYFIENSLNATKQERLGEIGTTQKETRKQITMQMPSDPSFTTSSTWLMSNVKKEMVDVTTSFQNFQRAATTMQQISKSDKIEGKQNDKIYQLSIPFLRRRTDFQVFFYGADKDANGLLTYEEIKRVLGKETPNEDVLVQFDDDDNKMYSYTELLRTFQLRD